MGCILKIEICRGEGRLVNMVARAPIIILLLTIFLTNSLNFLVYKMA